jgi:hypothetical protein
VNDVRSQVEDWAKSGGEVVDERLDRKCVKDGANGKRDA